MRAFSRCQNIKIDGDEFTSGFLGLAWAPSHDASTKKQSYETDIANTLDRLMRSWAGWAVINEIFYAQKQMTILPYLPTPETGPVNAYATPKDLRAATLKDTTALDKRGNLPAPGQPRTIGTGTGSDTEIRFSSAIFTGPSAPTGPGSLPDEILLHEMIHGLRQMQGRSAKESITGNPGMHNYEEFAAITISNVYRSEKGLIQLRTDHTGFAPLTGPTTNVATFKSTYQSFLLHMDIEQPRLCQNLRQISCAFNPFAI
jgi:hypothetical protein